MMIVKNDNNNIILLLLIIQIYCIYNSFITIDHDA